MVSSELKSILLYNQSTSFSEDTGGGQSQPWAHLAVDSCDFTHLFTSDREAMLQCVLGHGNTVTFVGNPPFHFECLLRRLGWFILIASAPKMSHPVKSSSELDLKGFFCGRNSNRRLCGHLHVCVLGKKGDGKSRERVKSEAY